MKRIGNILWIIISAFAILTLAITLIIPFIAPDSALNLLSGANLFFPYALVFALICVIVCLIRRQFYTVLCITAILLLSIPNIQKSIATGRPQPAPQHALKVVSYNVHYFNFYNAKQANALQWLQSCDADILCLQEVLIGKQQHTLTQLLGKLNQYPYQHVSITTSAKNWSKGIITLSKYPIIQRENTKFESSNHAAISSWVKINQDTLQVINCYLESNRLTSEEKEIYKSQEKANIAKRIYNKMASAAQKRGKQAETVVQLKDAKHPTLLCGDVNDLPTSWVYQAIKGDYTDTFLACGKGVGHTFHEGLYRFRIDYIMADEGIKPYQFSVDKQPYSDHYPIALQFTIQ